MPDDSIVKKPEYDWRRLKIEFLLSKYPNVVEWSKHTLSTLPAPNNSSFKNNTAGWKEDKDAMLQKEADLTVETVMKRNVGRNAKMYEAFLEKLQANFVAAEYLEPSELKQLWHMLRVELGLVTNIAKNENTNHDDKSPVDVLNGLLAKIKNGKSNKGATTQGTKEAAPSKKGRTSKGKKPATQG